LRDPAGDRGAPIQQDRHRHEEVDIDDDRAFVPFEPSLDLAEVRVTAWCIAHSVPQKIIGFTAAAVNSVVATAGVGDDRKPRSAAIRVKYGAVADIDVALNLDRIGGVVAVGRIGSIKAQEIDRLLAFQIHKSQDFATPHNLSHGLPAGTISSRMPTPSTPSASLIFSAPR
jgi:hypothetical protein